MSFPEKQDTALLPLTSNQVESPWKSERGPTALLHRTAAFLASAASVRDQETESTTTQEQT